MDYVFEKDRFIERINRIVIFREKEKELTAMLRSKKKHIQQWQSKSNQAQEELARILFFRNIRKHKKQEIIRECQKEIKREQEELQKIEDDLKKWTVSCFQSEKIPAVYLGQYPQGAGGEYKRLEWDVLYKKGENVLLATKYVIDHMRYAAELEETPWKESDIRKWLNTDFLNTAFLQEERVLIREKENANPGNDAYHTPESENTRDMIFLPSLSEVKCFSDYDEDRIACPTEYAKSKGVFSEPESQGSYWWLRSNGGNMINAAVVNFSGYVFEYGFYVNSDRYGVRPCMWVKLED